MQNSKGRVSPKESPTKLSPRPTRQLKVNSVELSSSSPSSNVTAKTPKEKSPKVSDRRSPRSVVCEKRPIKLFDLESQVSKLQNNLKTVKDQLIVSESLKKEARSDTKDVKRQLADVCLKLEESQKQLSELDTCKNATLEDQQDISRDPLDEIQSLKDKLAETCSGFESMKHELDKTKQSEAQSQILVNQTLVQLDTAKDIINALRSDAVNSTDAYNSIASELQQSRAQVSFLESYLNNLKKVRSGDCSESKNQDTFNVDELRMELQATKSEVLELRSALKASEIKFIEERSHSSLREAELAEQLKKAKSKVDELKVSLINKETELQCISEENENLATKLEKSKSWHIGQETEAELTKLRENMAELKAHLMDKETELQNILEENETVEVARAAEVQAARAAEVDMEAEMRRLKVQLDQWRKAAEAAASMLSSPGSNDEKNTPADRNISSPNLGEYDDDSLKKKNGNVLKKIGVLWKRPQK